jgi:hypothetical protein
MIMRLENYKHLAPRERRDYEALGSVPPKIVFAL